MTEVKVGQVVKSKAGRDKGTYMIVYKVLDKDYVLLVDGFYRKVEKPKKKKIKHLQLTTQIADGFVKTLQAGMVPTNNEVKKYISELNLPQV